MKDLRDTINLMNSTDYKDRFIAEYWQTKMRYEKLKAFNTRIEADTRVRCTNRASNVQSVQHDCPYDVLREQQRIMGEYLHVLELRAFIEDIDLDAPISNREECEVK